MTNTDQKIIITSFNYNSLIDQMNDLAKELFGEDFHISKKDPNITRILAWALRLEESAKKRNMDLKKGLLLVGEGTYKNKIMDLVRRCTFEPDYQTQFEMVSCTNISNSFTIKGPVAIQKYANSGKTICFTDLGREMKSQHYGISCYVMKDILYNRNEQFFQRGLITHLTTNLTANEVETLYGADMRSGMREMFNRVVLDP